MISRRLAYEVGDHDAPAAVVLCEHPFGVTVGREGSRAHVRLTEERLAAGKAMRKKVSRQSHRTFDPGAVQKLVEKGKLQAAAREETVPAVGSPRRWRLQLWPLAWAPRIALAAVVLGAGGAAERRQMRRA